MNDKQAKPAKPVQSLELPDTCTYTVELRSHPNGQGHIARGYTAEQVDEWYFRWLCVIKQSHDKLATTIYPAFTPDWIVAPAEQYTNLIIYPEKVG